jgi:D-inositol-3-phosphate glycosyltransferase
MLLFVGRIEPLKGVDTLIRAIAHMRSRGVTDRHPHYLAIIGGDPNASAKDMNSEMARLQALSKELGLEDLVVFLGKRSQSSLPYYYSAAEVLIMPSHYESFGMVALEAMACGTPVVASQVGGLAFLIQDGVTGYVVPGGDHIAMSQRLSELISQPDLRERLGQQASAYASNYSWENITSRVIDLYLQMLGEG